MIQNLLIFFNLMRAIKNHFQIPLSIDGGEVFSEIGRYYFPPANPKWYYVSATTLFEVYVIIQEGCGMVQVTSCP